MDIQELSSRIQPCDMDKPYAFVSYCSKDSERVWNDIICLQKKGYNLWIDRNLKETDDSWKNGAMDAIQDIDCNLVIFYMSRDSVTSSPCLEELRRRESQDAMDTHGGKKIPWIVVEVSPVGNIATFKDDIHAEIVSDESLAREKKNAMAVTLSRMMNEFFPNGEKIRIKSKDDESKRYDYYGKIEENLLANGVKKFNREEMYVKIINMFDSSPNFRFATELLDFYADEQEYLPAILMKAFILATGICGEKDNAKARESLQWATFQAEVSEWKAMADDRKKKRQYEQAVAFYSAFALVKKDADAFLEASRLWIKMKNASFEFTKKCALAAAKLGNADGKKLFLGFSNMTEEDFKKYAKNKN